MLQLNKQKVQEQFSRSAERYDQIAVMQQKIADELLSKAGTSLGVRHSSFVDLGCGTGYVLEQLERQANLKLHGLDLSPTMLGQAEKRLQSAELTQGDIESLPYANNAFDVLFSSSAIQWCDLGKALAEIGRVGKQDSRVFLSTFLEGTLQEWRSLWMSTEQREQHQFLSKGEALQCLQANGFQKIQLEEKVIEQKFTDLSEAIVSIRGIGAGNASQKGQQGLMGKQQWLKIQHWFQSK